MVKKITSSPGREAYLQFRKVAKLMNQPTEPWSKCDDSIQLIWHLIADAARKWEA